MDPKVVPCPVCHAEVGAPCTGTRSRTPGVSYQHWARFQAADARPVRRSE